MVCDEVMDKMVEETHGIEEQIAGYVLALTFFAR